ncbi:putative zinc-binding metallopeptidase [soil metagenome]
MAWIVAATHGNQETINYLEPVIIPVCPVCNHVTFLESQCWDSGWAAIGFDHRSMQFVRAPVEGVGDIDGGRLIRCSNWDRKCNWMLRETDEAAQCFSCRLTRRRPDSDDTLAMERLADAEVDKRRMLIQLFALGLPVTPYDERPGGLAFDLISSYSGESVMIGHADGVITIDLAEGLDVHRERLRVYLGEAYRTMLGHFRHEVGHYYEQVLASDEPWLSGTRELFGDETASYSDAIDRHYTFGAPDDWADHYISEYATMHPWEDFAETFAHYLHITGTLATAAAAGVVMSPVQGVVSVGGDVRPLMDYSAESMERMLDDWHWLSMMFNRVNRTMGQHDLYPFGLPGPVIAKLAFMHQLVTGSTSSAG